MRFLKKMMVVAMAVSAVASLAVVSANAMEATYNDETGKVALSFADGELVEGQKTLLILNEDATNITADNAKVYTEEGGIIVQIDQDTTFAEVTVGDLPAGTYYVRVGGAVEVGSEAEVPFLADDFVVGGSVSTRILGNVNDDEDITGTDALIVAKHVADLIALEGEKLLAADANDDGSVSGGDALEIAKYVAVLDSKVDGVKTISDKVYKTVE